MKIFIRSASWGPSNLVINVKNAWHKPWETGSMKKRLLNDVFCHQIKLLFLIVVFSIPLTNCTAARSRLKSPVRTYVFEFSPDATDKTLSSYLNFLRKTSPGLDGLKAQYSVAEVLISQGRYEEAAKIFNDLSSVALSDDFFNVSVLLKLADCYMHLGKYPEAFETYTMVRQSEVKCLIPEAILGMAVTSLALGDQNKAFLHFQELTAFYPIYKTRPHLMLPLGFIQWEMRKYKEALGFFNRDKDNPASLYFSGLCYRSINQPAKAMGVFRDIIKNHPQSVWAQRAKFELGETFYQQNDFSLASRTFSEIMADNPSDMWQIYALYRLACSDMQMGNPKEAESRLWTLYRGRKNQLLLPNVTYLLTESLKDQKKMDKVIKLLNAETKGQYKSPEYIYRLVWALTAEGKYAEAVKLSNEYLASDWDPELTPKTLLVQAYAYEKLNSPPESVACSQLVMEHFNETPYAARALEMMAMSYYKTQQYVSIITQVNHAWNALPSVIRGDHPETLFWIAEAHMQLKNGKNALDFYEQFLDQASPSHSLLAQAYQGQAVANALEKDFNTAVLVLQQALQTAQEDKNQALSASLALSIGNVYFNARDYENAATYYRQFEQIAPKHDKMPFVLYQGGLSLHRAEYYSDAVDTWERLVKAYPKDDLTPETLFRASKTRFDLGQYTEAIAGYEKLAKYYDDSGFSKDARLQIGQCYYNAGDFEKAIEAYTKYIKWYPDDPDLPQVVQLLQTCYYHAKKTPEEIEKLTKNQPKTAILADIYWEEGAKLYNEKKYAEARQYFEKIMFEFPSSSLSIQASFYRAESVFLQEKYKDAVPAYENFIKYYPNDPQKGLAMFHLAVSLFNEKDYLKSAGAFEKFAQEFPDDDMAKNANLNAALCYVRSLEVDKAVKAYLNYVALYPDSEDVGAIYVQLAQFLEKSGENMKAVEAYMRVPAKYAEHPEALFSAGRVSRKINHLEGEIEAYKRLQAFSNKNDPYRIAGVLQLAEIYLTQSNLEKAMKLYEDVIQNAADQQSLQLAQEQLKILQTANQ